MVTNCSVTTIFHFFNKAARFVVVTVRETEKIKDDRTLNKRQGATDDVKTAKI